MKCIRKGNVVKRVSDEEAFDLVVENMGWHYTSKGAWKSAGRPKGGDDADRS